MTEKEWQRHPGGRPPGKEFPVVKQVRLGTAEAARLEGLARQWGISEAAAMRRVINEAAELHGVEVDGGAE